MKLPEVFEEISASIVAFGYRIFEVPVGQQPVFPKIIGTGLVVHSDGLVVTNAHVIRALKAAPKFPGTKQSSAFGMLFLPVRIHNDMPIVEGIIPNISNYFEASEFVCTGPYYGEEMPDIGFVQLGVKGLKPATLESSPNTIRTGIDVATAGFPAGDVPLRLHGKITQLSPTLRKGIVSSVFPFSCANPHGFTIDAMIQGGASGSPVFSVTHPKVIGIVKGVNTCSPNATVCEPAHLIAESAKQIATEFLDASKVPTVSELVASAKGQDQGLEFSPIQLVPRNSNSSLIRSSA